MIESREKINQADVVTFQRPPGLFFNNRHAGTVQNRRRRAIEQAIHFGGLREVSNLSRAAIVRNGRQQKILHDRAQRYVWTEPFRFAQGPLRKFFRGIFSAIAPSLTAPTPAGLSVS